LTELLAVVPEALALESGGTGTLLLCPPTG